MTENKRRKAGKTIVFKEKPTNAEMMRKNLQEEAGSAWNRTTSSVKHNPKTFNPRLYNPSNMQEEEVCTNAKNYRSQTTD